MDLPRCFICGDRPVKLVPTEDGGMDVLAYDWKTGGFVRDMSYLTRCALGTDPETDQISQTEFDRRVASLRGKR